MSDAMENPKKKKNKHESKSPSSTTSQTPSPATKSSPSGRLVPQEVSHKRSSKKFTIHPVETKSTEDSSSSSHGSPTISGCELKLIDKDEVNTLEKALLEMAPRKAKRLLDRRKLAREKGENEANAIWDSQSSSEEKGHSSKQVIRISNELEQILSVLCNGDKSFATDVLVHLMKKRHLGSDYLVTRGEGGSNVLERTLDNRIVDGIVGFFEHHHSRGTRPTEAARAVDAVMVACCWDVCDNDDVKTDKSSEDSPPVKRVSNSALIDRLGVNRDTLKQARSRAKSIKKEGKARYKPKERKPRKDKGVPAQLYKMIRSAEEAPAQGRETNEYTAVDALSRMVTGMERSQIHPQIPSPQPLRRAPQTFPPSYTFPPHNSPFASMSRYPESQFAQIPYEHHGVSQSQFTLAEREHLDHQARNILRERNGPPPRVMGISPSYSYDQHLQWNPHLLYQPSVAAMDGYSRRLDQQLQGSMVPSPTQAPSFRFVESQIRRASHEDEEDEHGNLRPRKKEKRKNP